MPLYTFSPPDLSREGYPQKEFLMIAVALVMFAGYGFHVSIREMFLPQATSPDQQLLTN